MTRPKIARAMDYIEEDMIAGVMQGSHAKSTKKGAEKMKKSIWMKFAAIAASLVILVTGGVVLAGQLGGANAIIALDVNPSIELEVDKNEQVVAVNALNDDARIVIGDMNLENTDLDVAVNALLGSMYTNGYLTADQNSILISVDAKNSRRSDRLQESVAEKVTSVLSGKNINSSVITQDFEKGNAKNGVSAAKATLIDRIIDAGITNSKGIPYEYENLVGLKIHELKLILDSKAVRVNGIQSQGMASEGNYIGKDNALNIALENAGATVDTVSRKKVEFDYDDDIRVMLYEVEFVYNGKQYEYEINATTGDIVEIDIENGNDNDDNLVAPEGAITREDALTAAYAHAGVKAENVREIDCEVERFNGKYYYEIEFEVGNNEYEYIIDAMTGKVINSRVEKD